MSTPVFHAFRHVATSRMHQLPCFLACSRPPPCDAHARRSDLLGSSVSELMQYDSYALESEGLSVRFEGEQAFGDGGCRKGDKLGAGRPPWDCSGGLGSNPKENQA